jgi:phage terminase small subunit
LSTNEPKNEPNIKQKYKLFCNEYIKHGNAVEAAKVAGYSNSYAEKKSYLLLQVQEVKDYLAWLNAQIVPNAVDLSNEVRQFWYKVMIDDGEDMKHRLRASELLAKANGDFDKNTW